MENGRSLCPNSGIYCLQTVHQEYPWGECNPDIKLRDFATYSTYSCLKECKAQHIQRQCGCLPFLLPGKDWQLLPALPNWKHRKLVCPWIVFHSHESLCWKMAHLQNLYLSWSIWKHGSITEFSGKENDAVNLGPQFFLRGLKSDVLKGLKLKECQEFCNLKLKTGSCIHIALQTLKISLLGNSLPCDCEGNF